MTKQTIIVISIIVALAVGITFFIFFEEEEKENAPLEEKSKIENFSECVEAGYPVVETRPRKCQDPNGKMFIEEIGNEIEKSDLIRLDHPRPDQEIESPLKVEGEARGTWFFEGDFPVVLTNWDGLIIAERYATAQGDWMTEDFVEFECELEFERPELYLDLEFEKPEFYDRGFLILRKDNPSGLPENDDALEIPIFFK